MQAQAIIYTRTSTSGQTDGHQAQEDACKRYALSAGLEVRESYSDTISGSADIDKRDGLMSALGSLEKGDTLIIYRRDRLGRDVVKNAIIEKIVKQSGAHVHSLDVGSTETKEGTLLATLLDAFAEYERSVIMARVKANVESKKARGLCVGNTGLGETKVIRDGLNYIERDEEEAQKLEVVRSWRTMGLTHREILERCLEEGVMTRRGTAPTMSTIGTWVRKVKLSAQSAERLKVESDSKRGRKVGTRGQRAEDNAPALKALLISYINQGLTQSAMTKNLEEAGITNSKGKPYNKQQVQRFVSRLKAESK
jgi:DNA invertase Pin-like site-specific DNA recombinase